MSWFKEKDICNRRGFTLVELLVVISIIALLLAILMPALGRAREQAKALVCRSNLRQQSLAFILYAENNDRYPPVYDHWAIGGGWPHWWNYIRPYLSEKSERGDYSDQSDVYRCPSGKTGKEYGLDSTAMIKSICSYGMYDQLSFAKPVQVVRPSGCVAIVDIWCTLTAAIGPGNLVGMGHFGIGKPSWTAWDPKKSPPCRVSNGFRPSVRHNKGGPNIVWADGHVSWMTAEDLYDDGKDTYFPFSWDWSSHLTPRPW